jgi:hypothetical protein
LNIEKGPGKKERSIEASKGQKQRFKLIRGNYPYQVTVGSVDIAAAPENRPPFKVDAVAVEEDTFLVMSADRRVQDPKEPLIKIMTRVIETQPKAPGSVIVRGEFPLRFLAVVHDLNEEPTWREEWIIGALEAIFQEAEHRGLRSIALPFLGTLHGSLDKARFLVLLRSVMQEIPANHLKRIWLVVPLKTRFEILKNLQARS